QAPGAGRRAYRPQGNTKVDQGEASATRERPGGLSASALPAHTHPLATTTPDGPARRQGGPARRPRSKAVPPTVPRAGCVEKDGGAVPRCGTVREADQRLGGTDQRLGGTNP